MKFSFRTTLLVRLVGPVCVGLLALVWSPYVARAGETFVKIHTTGVVRCGISEGDLTGFSHKNAQGRWTGLNVDFCRAVAAAALLPPHRRGRYCQASPRHENPVVAGSASALQGAVLPDVRRPVRPSA